MTLETEIEQKFCEYAKDMGCYPVKFVDPARRGAPDRMVLCPEGRVMFIEFKAPGEGPRPDQYEYLDALRDIGFFATWVDDFELAQDELNAFLLDAL